MKVLGVIPARGGSKSIPLKNIVDLGGMPLIGHTIKSAKASEYIDTLIVSTDSEEIRKVSEGLGANVPFLRPHELSTDSVQSFDVIHHALIKMQEILDSEFDAVIMLQPTNPFRRTSLIDRSIEILKQKQCDSVVSMVDVGANHPHRMYRMRDDHVIPYDNSVKDPMAPRQLLPKVYIRSGDIYLSKSEVILDEKKLIGKDMRGIIVESNSHVNIDEPTDLEIAKNYLNEYDKRSIH